MTTDHSIDECFDDSVVQMLNNTWDADKLDTSRLRTEAQYQGFDNNCGDSWIYPTNYPLRQYQFNISRSALFKNTLVCLPTGLGKTFIAAVVMYNFYRWYPCCKIIFMAPTRPLVSQQVEACYQIMGIPKEDTTELTGQQQKRNRGLMWRTKRVFFVTPQILNTDLFDASVDFPISDVRLIVVDEAHKAKGRYAYVTVLQAIAERNKNFRVLALSATPGQRPEDVAEVVKNLFISSIEIRSENSIDVQQFTHKKNIRTIVVSLGADLAQLRSKFVQILDPFLKCLLEQNVIHNMTIKSRGYYVCQQQNFRQHKPDHPSRPEILSNFSNCITLVHALELLERHGTRIFLNFFNENSQNKYICYKIPELMDFLNEVRAISGPDPFDICDQTLPNGEVPAMPSDLDFGHPKFGILQQHLLKHFQENEDTRAIIFCEYRESVYLIHQMLRQNRPLIKSKAFVGKGGQKAVTQKEQLAVMKDFRAGTSNVLVATCVAEEGIDVGEVDLIVCFDINTSNPMRMVQRMGRTGRKRQGKVLMLTTEGSEHDVLKKAMVMKDRVGIVQSSLVKHSLYQNSSRLVPSEFNPKCIETFIKIPEKVDSKVTTKTSRVKRKKVSIEDDIEIVENNALKPKQTKKCRKIENIQTNTERQDLRHFFTPLPNHQNTEQVEKLTETEIEDLNLLIEVPTHQNELIPEQVEGGDRISQLISELKKYQRSMKNNPKTVDFPTIENVISSEVCPNILKKITLENNIEFLRENYKETNDTVEEVMIIDEKSTLIESVFGGKNNLLNVINLLKKKPKKYLNDEVFPNFFNELSGSELETDQSPIQILKKTKLPDRNRSHNQSGIDKILEVSPVKPLKESNDYINSQCEMLRYPENESKYLAQMNDKTHKFEKIKSSTPVVKNTIKHKLKTPAENSPLLKAFNKSIEKQKRKSALEYFKLNSVWDLFEDETDLDEVIPASQPCCSRTLQKDSKVLQKPVISSFKNPTSIPIDVALKSPLPLNESIEMGNSLKVSGYLHNVTQNKKFAEFSISDIFADDESFQFSPDKLELKESKEMNTNTSQATVSQILEIVNGNSLGKSLLNQNPKNVNESVIEKSANVSLNLAPKNQTSDKGNIGQVDNDSLSFISTSQSSEKENLIGNRSLNDSLTIKNGRTKNFDIGSIDDIFGSDDDDLFQCDKSLSKKSDNILQDSDTDLILPSQPVLICSYKSELRSKLVNPSSPLKSVNKFEVPSTHINFRKISPNKLPIKNLVNSTTDKNPPIASHNLELTLSPKSSDTSITETTSPSILSRGISYSKLRAISSRDSLRSSKSFEKSVLAQEQDVGRIDLSHFLPKNKPKYCDKNNSILEESLIPVTNFQNNRRIIDQTDSSSESDQFESCQTSIIQKHHKTPKRKLKKKRCSFIIEECEVSGDSQAEDENEDDHKSIADFIVENTIIEDEEVNENENNIDMQAKYLQSIKSPITKPGGFFRKPDRPKFNTNLLDIFSQEIDDSCVHDEEDSFVISDDDHVPSEDDELCVLEQAEKILKEKRQRKRKKVEEVNDAHMTKKRRKIIVLDDSSSSDGG